MTYNGWSNRETWLVNLHLGEISDEYREESSNLWEFERLIEAEINKEFDDAEEAIYGASETISPFIRDMMPDLEVLKREIDVTELVEAWTHGGGWCLDCDKFFEFASHEGRMRTIIYADGAEDHICGDCAEGEE